MADSNGALIAALRNGLAARADAAAAPAMQAYMKSAMPFHGVPAPQRRAVQAAAVQAYACSDGATLGATMRTLWCEARHREERYAAIELALVGRHRRLFDLSLLPIYETMIREGAWWDICDSISGDALPRLLLRHPAVIKPLYRRWARGGDLWLRRAAIIGQRRLKADFDAVLLYDTILPSIGNAPSARGFADQFFIRKGIGWALRERAYAAPDEVRAFCREYAVQLSPLTKREALRRIGPG